jgi:hypothetical protein
MQRIKPHLIAAGQIDVILFVSLLSVTLSGCGPQTVWSTKETSPNGQWEVGGRSERWSGPGNAAQETSVYLARTDDTKRPVEIVSYPEPGGHGPPTFIWKADDELVVRVPDPKILDLQVVKLADIRIVVEAMPNPATGGSSGAKLDRQ